MKAKRGFSKNVLASILDVKILGIRAGTKPNRVIGIWAVVVEGRVFVRSWSLKPRSWYRTFLEERNGAVRIGNKEVPVRSHPVRGKKLNDAMDRAYAAKYTTKPNEKYVKGFATPKRRATTLALVRWQA